MGVTVSKDFFTDIDTTPLEDHVPHTGPMWTRVQGSGITWSNKCSLDDGSIYTMDIGADTDQYAAVLVWTHSAQRMILRYVDPDNYYFSRLTGIWKRVGGVETELVSVGGQGRYLQIVGTILQLWTWDGSNPVDKLAEVEDSSISSGKVGLAAIGANVNGIDTWQAGSIGPPSTPTGLIATCVKEITPSVSPGDLTINPVSGEVGTSIDFSVNVSGTGPFTYLWEFGDGTTSTSADPSHAYTSIGIHQVRLAVSNSLGSDTVTQLIMIEKPGIITPPVSLFTADVQSGFSPLAVVFSDTSTGDPDTWEWYVDNILQASTQGFNHTFTEDGTYTVKLVVKKDGVWESESSMTILPTSETSLPPLISSISSSQSSSGVGSLTTTFSAAITGSVTAYLWDFGDGYDSNDASPTHKYTVPGIYTITITATNEYGSTSSAMQVVIILATDVVVLDGDQYINGQLVDYYVTDSGNNRILIYEIDGTYIATLGAEGAGDGAFNLPTRMAVVGGINLE